MPSLGPLESRRRPELQTSHDSAGKVSAPKPTHNEAVGRIRLLMGCWLVAIFSFLTRNPLHRAAQEGWLVSSKLASEMNQPERAVARQKSQAFLNYSWKTHPTFMAC